MNKNNDMSGLLALAYEIEGLLMLHIDRGDKATPEMKNLLVGKARQLLDGLTSGETEANQPPVAAAEAEPAKVAAEVTGQAPAVENLPESQPEAAPACEPVADTVSEADAEAVADSVMEEETGDANVAPATVNDTLSADTQLTLDEKLARQRAADISKAFTLNDRFRFCRELFRNSDSEFKETLEVIGSMSSMEEAEDYFFNDLCWDENSPVVKEFMDVVGKHF